MNGSLHTNENLQATSDGSSLTLNVLYYMFGIIVTSSVLLNFVALFFMLKDKELKRHSQHLMFMIISSTEIVIDLFYLCLYYWNRKFVNICHVLLIALTIGRNNVFFHLLYLCIERLCAITISLQNAFQILIKPRNRVIFLGISLSLSSALLTPPHFMYDRNESPDTCLVQKVYEGNGKFVLLYCRTVYCLELFIICLVLFFLRRKIRTLIGSVCPMENNKQSNCNNPTSTDNTQNDKHNCNSKPEQNTLGGVSVETTARTVQGKVHGLMWKIRAFKVTQATILATVIPSTPMLLIQIVGYINPDILSKKVDLAISMSNTAHAVIFPLVFIASVKGFKFCRK